MQTFKVDYNRIGSAKVFRAKLWPQHVGNVDKGSIVLVKGDDVPDRRASVEALIDGRFVELHFIDGLADFAERRSA